MRVDIIDQLEQFDTLAENWEAVYAADEYATFFVSWVWLRGWFAVAGYPWFVLALRPNTGSAYIAFLPLRRNQRQTRLTMGANPLATHTGFVCLAEYRQTAMAAFADYIERKLKWDNFQMSAVSDPRLADFLGHLSARRVEVEIEAPSPAPYLRLPPTWEGYLQTCLGRRTRENVRRYLRKVSGLSGFRVTELTADNLEQQLEIFLSLWQMRWGEQPDSAFRGYRSIARHCFQHDQLWLTILWHEQSPLAGMTAYVDRRRNTFSYVLSGWNRQFANLSPGKVIVAYSIQYAIENGFEIYDFLEGDEDYKFHTFGACENYNRNVLIKRNNLRLKARKLIKQLPGFYKIKGSLEKAGMRR